MFPQKHSFSYSYFYVGIPIGWRGSIDSLLSVDIGFQDSVDTSRMTKHGKPGWFSVDAEDYLDRGDSGLGLAAKLNAYLQSQGSALENYDCAYLVTAPRFCGYQFNPVSFWYLYSSGSKLKSMVLEVNNTFDERRLYFLEDAGKTTSQESSKERDKSCDDQSCDDHEDLSVRVDAADPSKFTSTWAKDFHVSPFNSRKGTYTLAAQDPLAGSAEERLPVDNRIILKSNKASVKLVTRVFSTERAIHPEDLTRWQTFRLILSWWWVGFMTSPRIVKEAWKLFFQKKLHVWYRPEVSKESIGRQHTKEERLVIDQTQALKNIQLIYMGLERILETWFRKYLADQVNKMPTSYAITFTPAGRPSLDREVFRSPSLLSRLDASKPAAEDLEIKILTPEFYTRFAHYAHTMEAFTAEMLHATDESKTIWVSKPEALPALLAPKGQDATTLHFPNLLDRWRWSVLQWLRGRASPQPPQPPVALEVDSTVLEDIRTVPLSALDRFVARTAPPAEAAEYRYAVKTIFLGDLVAFGMPSLLRLFDVLLRCVLILMAVRGAGLVIAGETTYCSGVGDAILVGAAVNGFNVWALLKTVVLG
ncbi:MAG: hypothetical protein M1837_000162 [Sclerophora amabilis]|nr:MAG: hypothetical protein M1837_000162 [Sclerophora amabilis]